MSAIINYIYEFWNVNETETESKNKINNIYHVNENIDNDYSVVDKKYLIKIEDLEKINLKPSSNIIPGPSRNMPPMDKFNLQSLNKAQLTTILNVKLKPIPYKEKIVYYEPKHPVLKELLTKFKNRHDKL